MDEGVDEPGPVRRRERGGTEAAVVVAVIHGAGGQDRSSAAVQRHAHHLEPAVTIRDQEQAAAVGQPARARLPCPRAGHDPLLAGGDVDDRDLHRGQVRVALGHDGEARPVGRPREVLDVDPDGGQGPRLGARRPRGRAAAAGQRGVHDPGLAPAASPRDEGDPPTVGCPARLALARGMVRHDGRARRRRRRRSRSPSRERTPAMRRPATTADRSPRAPRRSPGAPGPSGRP